MLEASGKCARTLYVSTSVLSRRQRRRLLDEAALRAAALRHGIAVRVVRARGDAPSASAHSLHDLQYASMLGGAGGGAAGGALPSLLLASAGISAVVTESKGASVRRTYLPSDPKHSDAPFDVAIPPDDRPMLQRVKDWLVHVYLPHGYPRTVTKDYLAFTLWRLLQNAAASIMGVFSTEALLLGLGLGKNVSGTAAALQWILKDGFGYVGKIAYASLAGKQFDMDPRSWRISADFLEDVGGALEIVTPLFSGQFLALASVATTIKAVAAMTGTATRHAIYKSVALAENQGDIATKGESQGVTCKLFGLGVGIMLSKRIGQNYGRLFAAYAVAAVAHLFANVQAMRCIEFNTLNRQRMIMLLREYAESAVGSDGALVAQQASASSAAGVAAIAAADKTESSSSTSSSAALSTPQQQRCAAVSTPDMLGPHEKFLLPPWRDHTPEIVFGASIKQAVSTPAEFARLTRLYHGERYLLQGDAQRGTVQVVLHENATPRDHFKAFMNAHRFLAERDAATAYRYTRAEFGRFMSAVERAGWNTHISLLNPRGYRARWHS